MQREVPIELLCTRISRGCARSEHQFYERFAPMAERDARRWLNSANDSEDIAHDALLTVLIRLREGTLREHGRVIGFLRRTVKFTALAHARRVKNNKMDGDTELNQLQDRHNRGGFEAVAQAQIRNQLTNLFGQLRQKRDQMLVRGHYIDDTDKPLLCDQYDLTAVQYDRVLHRARKRLRLLIELEAPEIKEEVTLA